MPPSTISIWLHDSNEPASGKPGTLHFWRLFKASVRSTHVQISGKHMQRYLDEFTFRATHRERVNGMFDLLVGAL
jgi:hypothetical protein